MPVIKRYANRKLYDTQARRYITLEGIAERIRSGEEIHVVDHQSGEDITAMTQAQIILDQEKKIKGGLPRAVLTGLIQTGSDTLSQLRRALTPPAAWKAQVDAEIEKRVHTLIQKDELSEEEGLRLLDRLIGLDEPARDPAWPNYQAIEHILRKCGVPSRTEVQALARQVEALAAQLDKLGKPARARAKRSNK